MGSDVQSRKQSSDAHGPFWPVIYGANAVRQSNGEVVPKWALLLFSISKRFENDIYSPVTPFAPRTELWAAFVTLNIEKVLVLTREGKTMNQIGCTVTRYPIKSRLLLQQKVINIIPVFLA